MRNPRIKTIINSTRLLAVFGATALAIGLGSTRSQAKTIDVFTDPAMPYYGYENVFTNGLTAELQPAYISLFLGASSGGTAFSFPNNSSIDTSGNVTIQADDWADVTSPHATDTLIWADASGTSASIANVLSDCYTQVGSSVSAGDTVIFTGTLVTNTLVAPYGGNAVLFIKDYDSSWGFHNFISVHLNTLTNGQTFQVTLPAVYGSGDFIQYGLEWSGPPVRSATAATYGKAIISTNGATIAPPPPPGNVYLTIDPSQAWAGYRNVSDAFGTAVAAASGYIGVGGQTTDFQATISGSGVVQCAPDISLDVYFQTNTSIWADTTSNLSGSVATYDNTFYVDSTSTGARGGDTAVFTGTLVTNALTDASMNGSLVAFIKDFGSDWTYYGETTVALNTLTNGQTFSITKPVNTTGDHVQWGFEWQGVPARTNPAAASYVGQYGYVIFSSNNVVKPGPQILSVTPASASVLIGGNASFVANVTGTGVTYKWQKNGVNVTDGGGVSGSTSSTLNFTNTQPSQEGIYNMIATDSGNLSATSAVSLVVVNPSFLYFDRVLNPFSGYVNAWNGTNLISAPPSSGLAGTSPKASFGFGVTPIGLVRASFNTNTDEVTLQPNTYLYDGAVSPLNTAYVNSNGTPAAYLEQDFFIQNDSLTGQTIVFSGYCSSNSLNSNYTALAFIKDGSPDWSVEHRYDGKLVAGKPFTVTVNAPVGDHIQYGFVLFGPDNSATNSVTQGAAVAKVYSPITSVQRTGSNLNITFPTVINHSYTVQYKTNLTDPSWNSLTSSNGTGVNIIVTNNPGSDPRRFYRLSTQ